jgi:hypothetical protein
MCHAMLCYAVQSSTTKLTVLRAALVNLCFSADGLSQVGSTGRGITAAAAMHEARCCRGALHRCVYCCCSC